MCCSVCSVIQPLEQHSTCVCVCVCGRAGREGIEVLQHLWLHTSTKYYRARNSMWLQNIGTLKRKCCLKAHLWAVLGPLIQEPIFTQVKCPHFCWKYTTMYKRTRNVMVRIRACQRSANTPTDKTKVNSQTIVLCLVP